MQQLLDKGTVSLNGQGAEGMTALMWTFLKGNRSGYEYLLAKGANPNLQMTRSTLTADGVTDGASVMWLAARHEDPWFLDEALRHGGDPNVPNLIKGNTAVFNCISMAERAHPGLRLDNLRLLIASGAKLDVVDRDGFTPLLNAAIVNRYDMVYAMLEAGADPNLAPNPRATLTSFIMKARTAPNSYSDEWRTRVIELLKANGAKSARSSADPKGG